VLSSLLRAASGRQDLVFAIFFILVVAMLIIPLPTLMVDVLLSINLAITLLILISTLYLRSALELSTFPALILVTTIFRLALSVSTTRLILANGDAGELVRGFGNFVVSGNVVVGLVIFMIVAIVQFLVVTKGAERIAEVSARFTLDALPGKQMSIDAEQRNGDIDAAEARRRRSNLEKESQFFGAMDGAMRFVKGDAIAGLIIIAVNLLGGLLIGVIQRGMPFSEAGATYTLLTVGDGLVAQIPAMFIAIAAGTVVTRVASDDSENLGQDIGRQLSADPRAMAIAAVFMLGMAAIPGFPAPVFLGLAALLGLFAWLIVRRIVTGQLTALRAAEAARAAAEAADAAGREVDPMSMASPPVRAAEPADVFTVALAPGTLEQLQNSGLYVATRNAVEAVGKTFGFQIPLPGYRADASVEPGVFVIEVEGVPVERGRVEPGRMRVEAAPDLLRERGIEVDREAVATQPGRAVAWVEVDAGRELQSLGATGWFAAGFVADRLRRAMRQNVARAFGVNEATAWLAQLQEPFGRLAGDVQQGVPILTIVETLRLLLAEGVPIGQPRPLLECLLQFAPSESDPQALAARLRVGLKRQVSFSRLAPDGTLPVFLLAPDIEDVVRRVVANGMAGGFSPSEQQSVLRLVGHARDALAEAEARGRTPTLLVAGDMRANLRQFLVSQGLDIAVMSFDELAPEFRVQPVATLSAMARQRQPARPPAARQDSFDDEAVL
jgi:type III secretion protein V